MNINPLFQRPSNAFSIVATGNACDHSDHVASALNHVLISLVPASRSAKPKRAFPKTTFSLHLLERAIRFTGVSVDWLNSQSAGLFNTAGRIINRGFIAWSFANAVAGSPRHNLLQTLEITASNKSPVRLLKRIWRNHSVLSNATRSICLSHRESRHSKSDDLVRRNWVISRVV